MRHVESQPKLPEEDSPPPKPEVAITESWQKGADSVRKGARTIFNTITTALVTGKGALIGRHGTIELSTMLQLSRGLPFDPDGAKILERNAGVFPATEASVREWLNLYRWATESADIMAAGWYTPLARAEWSFLDKINPSVKRIPLRSLEPYYVEPVNHWTRALDGQRVTVVSSFTETMRGQLQVGDLIWRGNDGLLPNAKWSFVRSYYSPALAKGSCGWPKVMQGWQDAILHLETEVLQTKPEIVLLGCGALAMPLAARLKQKGIVAIVLGGAIQVLFGIKGRRWETHPVISGLWNEHWVFPNPNEIPKGAREVEGGCYW